MYSNIVTYEMTKVSDEIDDYLSEIYIRDKRDIKDIILKSKYSKYFNELDYMISNGTEYYNIFRPNEVALCKYAIGYIINRVIHLTSKRLRVSDVSDCIVDTVLNNFDNAISILIISMYTETTKDYRLDIFNSLDKLEPDWEESRMSEDERWGLISIYEIINAMYLDVDMLYLLEVYSNHYSNLDIDLTYVIGLSDHVEFLYTAMDEDSEIIDAVLDVEEVFDLISNSAHMLSIDSCIETDREVTDLLFKNTYRILKNIGKLLNSKSDKVSDVKRALRNMVRLPIYDLTSTLSISYVNAVYSRINSICDDVTDMIMDTYMVDDVLSGVCRDMKTSVAVFVRIVFIYMRDCIISTLVKDLGHMISSEVDEPIEHVTYRHLCKYLELYDLVMSKTYEFDCE